MENENIENLNSLNEETSEMGAVPKEKYQEVVEKNKQLFERAKQAEGEIKELRAMIPPKDEPKAKTLEKSNDLDFGQIAFHNTKTGAVKIEHNDDIDFLRNSIKETGKTQEQIMSANWFKAELSERQSARTAVIATPASSGRGSTGVEADNFDLVVAKFRQSGTFPPNTPMEVKAKVADTLSAEERMGGKSPFGESSFSVGKSQE